MSLLENCGYRLFRLKKNLVPHTNVCTIQPQQVGRAVGKRVRMRSCQLTSGAVVCRSVDGRLRGPRF